MRTPDEMFIILSGTTAYQATNSAINEVAKRYRFTGKERDEETGLNYHGARYYATWLARWTAIDPLEIKYAGISPYNYGLNNPVSYYDPTGMSPQDDRRIQTYSQAVATHTTNFELGAVRQMAGGIIRYADAILTPSYSKDDRLVGYEVYSSTVHTEMPLLEIGANAVGDFKKRYGNGLWAGAILGETSTDPNIKRAGAEYSVGHFSRAWDAVKEANSEAWSDPTFRANFFLSWANASLGFISRPVPRGNINVGPGESTADNVTNTPKVKWPSIQVRQWYEEQIEKLDLNVAYTEENARRLSTQRNLLKIEAREMMANRQAAADLEITDPIRSFASYVEKYTAKGFKGEALWEKIIKQTKTPNASVTKRVFE